MASVSGTMYLNKLQRVVNHLLPTSLDSVSTLSRIWYQVPPYLNVLDWGLPFKFWEDPVFLVSMPRLEIMFLVLRQRQQQRTQLVSPRWGLEKGRVRNRYPYLVKLERWFSGDHLLKRKQFHYVLLLVLIVHINSDLLCSFIKLLLRYYGFASLAG